MLRALVKLGDWAKARSANQLRLIMFCRTGKHVSRACAWVMLHCLQRLGTAVTLRHLSGKMCWESQKGMLCRHCSHVGNSDRNDVLNRTFDIICKKPYKFPYKVQPTPKSKAIPKKRSADMAMVSESNKRFLRSSCTRFASGHLKACTDVTANAVEKAVTTHAAKEAAKAQASTTATVATAQIAAAANAQAATEAPVASEKPLYMAKAESATRPSLGPRPPSGPRPRRYSQLGLPRRLRRSRPARPRGGRGQRLARPKGSKGCSPRCGRRGQKEAKGSGLHRHSQLGP